MQVFEVLSKIRKGVEHFRQICPVESQLRQLERVHGFAEHDPLERL
jgi:hypothetical protein